MDAAAAALLGASIGIVGSIGGVLLQRRFERQRKGKSVKINRSRIDMTKLRAMPENERALFVLLGHAVNEINVLNKTFYLATQYNERPEWRAHAHSSQSLVFARALTGKLYEAWQLLQKGYYGTQLSREYDKHVDAEVKDALDGLGRYFSRENIVAEIRNRFAFHYSLDDAKVGLALALPEDKMIMYLATDNGNTLYYFSEVVVNAALLEALEPGAHEKAMERLRTESQRVVGWFNDAAQGIMYRVVEKYLLDANGKMTFDKVDIGIPAVAEEVEIPYFITTNLPKEMLR